MLRPDDAPAFFLSSRPALPCPPASCPWFSSCSCCCPCLSCQTCILCAPALSPVSVMCAAFVVVLVPACHPVACCTCFCRRHVPALTSALCQSFPYLVSVCRPGGAYASVCLGGCRRSRRRWWSSLVKIEGDSLNTQHAQHQEAVFIRDCHKRGFAQRASGATPTHSSHRCDECVASVHA